MEVYSAKEKDDLLIKIRDGSPSISQIIDSREKSILDIHLARFVTIHTRAGGAIFCSIDQVGVDFLSQGGFRELDRLAKIEQKEKDTIYELEREERQLSINEYNYQSSIRKWKLISLLLGIALALLSIYTFFVEH